MDLATLVADFAIGMQLADAQYPVAVNQRSKEPYQPGLGPHTEANTVALVIDEVVAKWPERYGRHQLGVPYPDGSRQRCDLCLGTAPDWGWAIEVKLVRMLGDNGKPNDNLPTHILSPYPRHRSALTDCEKLVGSGLGGRKAILIFGYEYELWPLEPMVEAFEVLARRRVLLGERKESRVEGLTHPVHQQGAVFAWELSGPST